MLSDLGPFAGLEWHFSVYCNEPVLTAELDRVLAPLRRNVQPVGQYLLTAPTQGHPGSIRLGDITLYVSQHPQELLSRLLWHINLNTVKNTTDYVLLHAAAVADEAGRAVVLCAPMEAGKTTLAAGLVSDGLAYLTDETTAIRPSDLALLAYPKALSVDRGSWDVLAHLEPLLPPEAAHLVGDQWQLPPANIRPDAVRDEATTALVVLPAYRPGCRTELTPISPGEALLDLLQQTFNIRRDRRRAMSVLARVVTTARCYRLQTSDLDEAVSLVRAALRE